MSRREGRMLAWKSHESVEATVGGNAAVERGRPLQTIRSLGLRRWNPIMSGLGSGGFDGRYIVH